MRPLKIIFMGSPEFAVPSLEKLHVSHHQILAVASNPDRRRGRRSKPSPTEVKEKALALGYPVIDVENVKTAEFYTQIAELEPDLLVVVAFRILPPSILNIPKYGSVNLHASLLPKYRGAAPIHWAIINGEKETGCTVFFLDEKVDGGKIISQAKTEIGLTETTGDLYARLKMMGADLLAASLDEIASGNVKTRVQNEELVTPAPRLFTENTKVDFNNTVMQVHNKIRGLNPFPIAWCNYEGKKMNLYRSKPGAAKKMAPGKLFAEQGILLAGCADGALELTEIQLPGSKRLSGTDFINGYDLSPGLS